MFDNPTVLSYYAEVRRAEDLRERRTSLRSSRRRFSFAVPNIVKFHYQKRQQAAGLR